MNNNFLLNTMKSEIEELKRKEREYQSKRRKLDNNIWDKKLEYHERTDEEQIAYLRDVIRPFELELKRLSTFVHQLSVNRQQLETAHKVVHKYGYEGGKK